MQLGCKPMQRGRHEGKSYIKASPGTLGKKVGLTMGNKSNRKCSASTPCSPQTNTLTPMSLLPSVPYQGLPHTDLFYLVSF